MSVKTHFIVKLERLCLVRHVSFSWGVDHLLQTAMNEIPEIIMQCVSRDEAALAIAQKVSYK